MLGLGMRKSVCYILVNQSELIGQWLHHTISLMYVGARHLEFGITYHIVT